MLKKIVILWSHPCPPSIIISLFKSKVLTFVLNTLECDFLTNPQIFSQLIERFHSICIIERWLLSSFYLCIIIWYLTSFIDVFYHDLWSKTNCWWSKTDRSTLCWLEGIWYLSLTISKAICTEHTSFLILVLIRKCQDGWVGFLILNFLVFTDFFFLQE